MRMRCVWRAGMFGVVMMAALFVLAFLVMTLWNWLVPELFARPAITFWQALGLLLLTKILLGGFRMRPGRRGLWRARMRERWASMTPEEREKFRRVAHDHCRWSARPLGDAR